MVILFSPLANSIESPSTAFYYAKNPPLDLLAAYDRVVLEPDNANPKQIQYLQQQGVTVYAYLSIGEVAEYRNWFTEIKNQWKRSNNADWNSTVMDMTATGWHDYLLNKRMQQLWQQGYRGFFLDTMDSYQLFVTTAEDRIKQQQGMITLLKAMKQKYPDSSLLFNRGFEILEQTAKLADGLIAESLFAGWDPAKSEYKEVPANDRAWLLAKLKQARDTYNLPVTVLDYLPPTQRDQAKEVAKKISAAGFTPWVSTSQLDYMGVSHKNLIPRKVLFLYDSREIILSDHPIHRLLAMPLEYQGYVPIYWDIAQGLPQYILKGRIAGIVLWLVSNNITRDSALSNWVYNKTLQQLPIAFMGSYVLGTNQQLNKQLGISFHPAKLEPPLKLKVSSKHIGFEISPVLRTVYLPMIKNDAAPQWLSITGQKGKQINPVFIRSWGGVALSPYILQEVPAMGGNDITYNRWIINPFEFLTAALKLKPIPVPDATTENGNRILTIHIDGDGFYNKTQLGQNRYSPELIRDEFIKPLSLPHTVSIIEGEIGPTGLKPELNKQMEKIAKDIFKLSNVEIASHSYSHPFDWFKAAESKPNNTVDLNADITLFKTIKGRYYLPIPGYSYNAEREIKGSINYIDQFLAPLGKKTKVFLWTGDCLPNQEALAWTKQAQVASLNGGDTIIRKGLNSISNIAPSGIVRGPYFQPYAPIQNENVYTNDWTGPFYGYQRVIETFQLTNSPKRFKPISIYYHFYSGDRQASVRALHRVYDWATKQEILPLWISEYTPRLKAFRHAVYEQLDDGWRIYGTKNIRTLRLPAIGNHINISDSQGIAGYRQLAQGQYISLNGDNTISLRFNNKAKPSPYLVKSNAQIQYWYKDNHKINFRLTGHQAISLTLANLSSRCVLKNKQGKQISAIKHRGNTTAFIFKQHDTGALQVNCGR